MVPTAGPEVTITQFRAAKDDLIAIMSRGMPAISFRDAPRITVDVCLLMAYPLQFLRDRDPNPVDPTDEDPPVRFGLRGQSEDWDRMCDAFKQVARQSCIELDGIDSDKYHTLLTAAPVEGPVIDWMIRLAVDQLIDWLVAIGEKQGLDLGALADWLESILHQWF